MAVDWYIEAARDETWVQASDAFARWLQETGAVRGADQLGWSEGELLQHPATKKRFFCFAIPTHHGSHIGLFEEWARATSRTYGRREGERVVFHGTSIPAVTLAGAREVGRVPPWLK